jgi:hypothetical protein
VSETVTLKSYGAGSDWTSSDGKIALTFYDCVFDRNGSDFSAQWGKKQGTGEPTVGESLEGEFYEKGGKQRFRKASKPQGGGGGGERTSGGRGNWQPEGDRDPEKVARITRAHSQNCAVELLKGREDFNKAPKAQRQEAITQWASFFEADIQKAAAVALTKEELAAQPIRAVAADGEIEDESDIPF